MAETYAQSLDKITAALSKRLDVSFSANPFRAPRRRFAIICAPRVGSHLLCEGLLGYGAPVRELFRDGRIDSETEKHAYPSYEAYCRAVVAEFTVDGVFGVQGGLQVFHPLLAAGELPKYAEEWKFVHLIRRNAVRQAISHLIAARTSAWNSSLAPRKAIGDGDYDARAIRGFMERHAAMTAQFKALFNDLHVKPLRVTYEELSADPPGVTAQVAAFVGLDAPPLAEAAATPARNQKQTTPLNWRWEKRFREEAIQGKS